MKQFFLYVVFSIFTVSAYAQADKLLLQVKEGVEGKYLPFAVVKIGNKLNKTTNENGELFIEKESLNISDSLIVEYIGFETYKTNISIDLLNKNNLQITLTEKTYQLEDIFVSPKKFNAHKFFRRNLKSLLIPYMGKINTDLAIFYGDNFSKKIRTKFIRDKNGNIKIDSTMLSKDELSSPFLDSLPRITLNAVNFSVIFCSPKFRKKFECFYKGKDDKYKNWKFVLRKEEEKSLIRKSSGLKTTCIVKLNSEGVIDRVEGVLVEHDCDSSLIFYDIKYTLFKQQLIAERIHFTNYVKGEKDFDIKFHFSNFRKK